MKMFQQTVLEHNVGCGNNINIGMLLHSLH